ncbi:hypothetical protein [Paraburkholderia youngii]|uniref:Uncharacterized protein n=1 Tax=Paraburkholderia youngii TaxID=2782701 RepID=A0A7Y6K8Z7_9BURK|nr:hypothetical protein [Paraburkholderia youngii]NUY05573.1 hypothetical protein [Paraburkholderia youngii]
MRITFEDAFAKAQQTKLNRRLLVALIDHTETRWWGGHVDKWRPNEALFSSGASLRRYRGLVSRFKRGKTAKAHMLMFHSDGTFGTAIFGVESAEEAQELLHDTLIETRIRTCN